MKILIEISLITFYSLWILMYYFYPKFNKIKKRMIVILMLISFIVFWVSFDNYMNI
jgi:hypothetical protein